MAQGAHRRRRLQGFHGVRNRENPEQCMGGLAVAVYKHHSNRDPVKAGALVESCHNSI